MVPPSSGRPNRLLARPWLLAFVPINAATSAFAVAFPLLILITLHGAWAQVALAASLFNGAVILASMLWGHLADRFPTRRKLLLLNYVGFGVIYLAASQVHSFSLLLVLYTVVGLLAPAGTSASNLLILEQFRSGDRPIAYASMQEMSIVGSMSGLLFGYFWLYLQNPLPPLLLGLAALALVSALLVQLGIKDSPRRMRTLNVADHPDSLSSRIRHSVALRISIPFFPKRPSFRPGAWRRFRVWVRKEVHHEIPLILAAGLLFNFSSNLFNVSYTPYLYAIGIGAASIFLVNFSNNLAQGIVYPISGNLTARIGADRLVQRSTYVRSLGYLMVAAFTLIPLLNGREGFGSNVIAYAVLGAAIAFYSTASSMILFRALDGRDAGTLLGLNSALGGIAAVGGAVVSGILALFGSFGLTFFVAAAALLASVPLWAAAHVAWVKRHAVETVVVAPSPPVPRPGPRPEIAQVETD
jgi:MFS family permease